MARQARNAVWRARAGEVSRLTGIVGPARLLPPEKLRSRPYLVWVLSRAKTRSAVVVHHSSSRDASRSKASCEISYICLRSSSTLSRFSMNSR
jgi:hypothetical protein